VSLLDDSCAAHFFIADVSSSVFIQPLLLIDFVQKYLNIDVSNRKLTKPEHTKVWRFSPSRIQNGLFNVELHMHIICCCFLNFAALEGCQGCED
jgi:hypothetical protein